MEILKNFHNTYLLPKTNSYKNYKTGLPVTNILQIIYDEIYRHPTKFSKVFSVHNRREQFKQYFTPETQVKRY